jgi:hypothetical protein
MTLCCKLFMFTTHPLTRICITQGCVGEKFSATKEVEKQQLDLSRCVVLSKIMPKEFGTEKAIERALREIGVVASQVVKAGNVSEAVVRCMQRRRANRQCVTQPLTTAMCTSHR